MNGFRGYCVSPSASSPQRSVAHPPPTRRRLQPPTTSVTNKFFIASFSPVDSSTISVVFPPQNRGEFASEPGFFKFHARFQEIVLCNSHKICLFSAENNFWPSRWAVFFMLHGVPTLLLFSLQMMTTLTAFVNFTRRFHGHFNCDTHRLRVRV